MAARSDLSRFSQAETEPAKSLEDAADDAEVWLNKADPSKSIIFGTDKKTGLLVLDLGGRQTRLSSRRPCQQRRPARRFRDGRRQSGSGRRKQPDGKGISLFCSIQTR